MGFRDSWHGSRRHDPTVVRASRPVHQFRSKQYAEDYELISDFETIGDWTLTAGDSIAVDAVNFKEGFQGIRWRSVNSVQTWGERTISLNALGNHFELWVYIDNLDNLLQIYIDFEVAAPWARYFRASVRFWGIFSGWNKLGGLSRASFESVFGAVNAEWANVTKVRIRVQSTVGTTVNVTFDDFRMVRTRFAGKVTLRFDDNHESDCTESRPRMDEYGFRGVSSVIISSVGSDGRNSLAQLEHLQERGWDIVSHCINHTNLTTLTPPEVEKQLWNSQRWLTENGFYKGSRFIVPPFGGTNPAVQEQIKKYFVACCYRAHAYNAIPPVATDLTSIEGVVAATPLATVQGWIDQAKENQGWAIIIFHDISGMLVLFQDIIDYIEANGLEVVTFSDVFDDMLFSPGPSELFVDVKDPNTNLGTHPAVNLPDGADTTVRFQFEVPAEFESMIRAQVIVAQTVTPASPNMQWSTATNWGKKCADEDYDEHTDLETDQVTAITQNKIECIDVTASLTDLEAGDLVGFEFIRRATQAGDTINGAAFFLGFRLRYV